MKLSFNCWSASFSPLKILRFCVFHIHLNQHRGVICQTWPLFLSKPLNFHSRSRFLTVTGNTLFLQKIDKRNAHNTFVLAQWIKLWSVNSSLSFQRPHLLTIVHPSSLTCYTWDIPSYPQWKTWSQRSMGTQNFFGWEVHSRFNTQWTVVQLYVEDSLSILLPN